MLLGFVVLILVPSFLLLSRWQWHRLDDRRQTNAVVEQNSGAAPVPVAEVMTVGSPAGSIGDAQLWRPITATGTYDAAKQVLVRKRPRDGENGFWVVTPLVTDGGVVLAVNRGWLQATGNATSAQDGPSPPTGEVTVTGRVRMSEVAPMPQPSDLPPGQITDLDVTLVSDGAQTYPGYVDLMSSTPSQSGPLEPIPLPDLTDGPHLSYALQWIMFALVAVGGFIVLARRERALEGTESAQSEAVPHDPVT